VSVRTILIAVLALAFGTSAAVGVNVLRNRVGGPKVDQVAVVVASGDIPRFTTLTLDHLKVSEFPKSIVPAGTFQKIDDVIDRVVDSPFIKGTPLLEAQLSPKGAGRGAAAVIPHGMRAVTIKTPNAESGVAGFILPGNKVDVILTVKGGRDEDGGGSTKALLQNVEILAVDQKVEAPSDNKMSLKELRSVTLLVTPQQANDLYLGQNMGTLHLSLRNPLDTAAVETGTSTLRALRGATARLIDERMLKGIAEAIAKAMANRPAAEKPAPVAAKAPPPPLTIRTLRGTSAGSVPLQ